jgi:hypothetical protein
MSSISDMSSFLGRAFTDLRFSAAERNEARTIWSELSFADKDSVRYGVQARTWNEGERTYSSLYLQDALIGNLGGVQPGAGDPWVAAVTQAFDEFEQQGGATGPSGSYGGNCTVTRSVDSLGRPITDIHCIG